MQPSRRSRVVCDVSACTRADLELVESLARLALTARRARRPMRVRHASEELRRLLAFLGLAGCIPCDEDRSVEPRRQSEEREVGLGVEEEGDAGDPSP